MPELPSWARLDKSFPRIKWPKLAVILWRRLIWILVFSDTTAIRFFFAFGSFGFGYFIMNSHIYAEGLGDFTFLRKIAHPWALSNLLALHGLVAMYGLLSRKFTNNLFILEGVFGFILWGGSAIAIIITQSTPGGSTVMGILGFWLMIRYPSTEEVS